MIDRLSYRPRSWSCSRVTRPAAMWRAAETTNEPAGMPRRSTIRRKPGSRPDGRWTHSATRSISVQNDAGSDTGKATQRRQNSLRRRGVVWIESLGSRFHPAFDLLEAAVRDCTDELWQANLWEAPND